MSHAKFALLLVIVPAAVIAACGSSTSSTGGTASTGTTGGSSGPTTTTTGTTGSGGAGGSSTTVTTTGTTTTTGMGGAGGMGTTASAGGAGGMGTTTTGAGGAGGMAMTGACTDAADKAALADMNKVDMAANTCGSMCFADPNQSMCSGMCMVQQLGITNACGGCWGDEIACGIQHCALQCAGGSSPGCLMCTDMNCTPAFKACAGG